MKKVQNRRTKIRFKKMKKSTLGIFALFFTFIIGIFVVLASENPVISITSKDNASRGEEVKLTLNLDNEVHKNYSLLSYDVEYDKDVLELVKTTKTAYATNEEEEDERTSFDLSVVDTETAGVASWVFSLTGENANGESNTVNESIRLGTMTFRVKADAPGGKTEIKFKNVIMSRYVDAEGDGSNIVETRETVDVEDGYIDVVIPVDEDSVALAKTDYVIQKGETDNLTVEFEPEDTTDSKEFTYTPADNTIVSIDENGVITGLKTGTTTITVNAFGKELTANVEVRTDVKSVVINGNKHEIAKNEELQLEAVVTPSDADDKTITWASTNPTSASVDQTGKVTGLTNGTTTITATSVNNIVGEYVVSVVVPVTNFTVAEDEMELAKGESATISTTIEPNDATNKTITWKSSDEEVATVNDNGQVTAIGGGTATITGTLSNGMSVEVTVTVVVPLESISLDTNSIELVPTGEHTFVATKNPTDTTDTRNITWTSSDDTTVSVNSNGKVTAIKAGTATITASIGTISATATVKVLKMIDNVAMSDPNATLNKNQKKNLSVIIDPNDTDENYTITWSSSDESVATVDNNGKVTAVKGGTTTITATVKSDTSADKEVTCEITVVVPLTGISLNKSETEIVKGEEETLNVIYNPTDTTDEKTVTWESSDETVATVDTNGKVSAIKGGNTTITATVGTLTAVCSVDVIVPITSVTINNKPTEAVNRGGTINLTATVLPNDTTEDNTVNWASSNAAIASVDANGVVIAKKAGTATITASAGSKSDTAVIEVVVPIESFEISKPSTTIIKGKSETLTTTINPSDTTENTTITWTSSNNAIATVDSNGKVTGKAQGTVTITGKLPNDMTVTCEVTVNIIPVESIEITDGDLNINKKDTKTLNLKINPNDTTEATDVEWTSSDEEVVTVDSNGKITGIKEGSATITATMGNFTDSIEVAVKEIPLEAISLSNNAKKVQAGKNLKLAITLNPANTTDDVTFTYKSSDESIAIIDENGNIIAKKTGKVKIKVLASNGLEDEIEIEVTAPTSPKTGVTPTSIFAGILGILSLIGICVVKKIKI